MIELNRQENKYLILKKSFLCALYYLLNRRGIGGSCHVVDSVRKEKERLTAVSTSKQRFGDSSSTIPQHVMIRAPNKIAIKRWVMG